MGWPRCASAAAWASRRLSSASERPGPHPTTSQGDRRTMSSPTAASTIRWERSDDGIVTLVLDDPHQSANTMNAAFVSSLTAVADRLEAERDSIRGIVVTSAKKTFFAGGDL